MADIDLLIKIPEELYEAYKGRPPLLGDTGMDMIAQAIANGTPKKVWKWIKTYEPNDAEPFILWKCEHCGLSERIKKNYCPNCGEKMEVEE